jgi:hypothetical protein
MRILDGIVFLPLGMGTVVLSYFGLSRPIFQVIDYCISNGAPAHVLEPLKTHYLYACILMGAVVIAMCILYATRKEYDIYYKPF